MATCRQPIGPIFILTGISILFSEIKSAWPLLSGVFTQGWERIPATEPIKPSACDAESIFCYCSLRGNRDRRPELGICAPENTPVCCQRPGADESRAGRAMAGKRSGTSHAGDN